MRVRATVPALREGVRLVELDGGMVLEDEVRKVRLPLDALGALVCEALERGPLTPDELTARVSAGRLQIFERVGLLNRHSMLSTARGLANVERHREARASMMPFDRTLSHDGGLRHTCGGCGGCCTGTELGPLTTEDVARVLATDWGPHLPEDVEPKDWIETIEMPSGARLSFLGRRHDRCVFLRPDNRCTIHAVGGPNQKPLMCRQFPRIFLRVPQSPSVHVGFAAECRSWDQARVEGATVEDSTEELLGLLDEQAEPLVIEAPLEVWSGLDWSWSTWSSIRFEQLASLRTAEDFAGLIDALAAPILASLESTMKPFEEEEVFITRAGFGIPSPPTGPLTTGGALHEFRGACDRLEKVLVSGLAELADRYEASGEASMARRHRVLADSIAHLVSGQLSPAPHEDPEVLEIWREMALAAADSHEIARRGNILHGCAELLLKLLLARHDCHLGVSDSLRARVETQDVVDRMVRVTKMLRGALVSALMRQISKDLVALFLFNSSVFTRGTVPRALGHHAATRLPGELR